MASEEFTEGSEQKRPNVQMGDPFMEKLLLEACLEAMATGAVLGIQDMGAAGLTCSTCEMGARGGLGLTVELDRVPQRETGMTSYEIMLSESQERMLLVADKARATEVLDVFSKWGLDASIVGHVTAEPNMHITQGGVVVANIPNQFLTDDAPVYHRPVGTWKAPVPLDPPAHVLEELKKPRDYTADLKKLLASANICDKRWVYEQYDSMVQTNTVQGPGGEAGVMRIKGTGAKAQGTGNREQGTAGLSSEGVILSGAAGEVEGSAVSRGERGLAMALAGNGRWCYLDPKLGAMHAVAEATRKVACTGATPVSATNCLNFGNPEKPEIMAQLSAAIDGIAEACTALGTPITGGNVSLYNETKGEGIYPTPVLGIVGIIDDVTKAVPSSFQRKGDTVILISGMASLIPGINLQSFGSSEFAKSILGSIWGMPPSLDVEDDEATLQHHLIELAKRGLIRSACDVSDGGIAVALSRATMQNSIGVKIDIGDIDKKNIRHPMGGGETPATVAFFAEYASQAIVSVDPANTKAVLDVVGGSLIAVPIGQTVDDSFELKFNEGTIRTDISSLRTAWSGALESQIADEVVTA
jgi:phosphoribosylformylglycinamidine synthase